MLFAIFLRQLPLFSLLGVHSSVPMATVWQLSLVSLGNVLSICTKLICVLPTGNFSKFGVEDHRKTDDSD